ncbi:microfibril-associated glycoprotein 3 isoform X2 [Pteropus medius]|uniref:microfibril-associated glycoprotein 3 isoform X2 n=1 Tax=Pteropus vampyrus TaxID=132908 RepID=UPI00196BA3B0|nr:microfibril-associated glycoprotein 3 isoform X2 [Pteropus giganteus]
MKLHLNSWQRPSDISSSWVLGWDEWASHLTNIPPISWLDQASSGTCMGLPAGPQHIQNQTMRLVWMGFYNHKNQDYLNVGFRTSLMRVLPCRTLEDTFDLDSNHPQPRVSTNTCDSVLQEDTKAFIPFSNMILKPRSPRERECEDTM